VPPKNFGFRISDFEFVGAGRLVGLIEAGLPAVGRKRLGIRNWECRRPGGDPSTRSLRSLAQDDRVGWSISRSEEYMLKHSILPGICPGFLFAL
jgi:hypothetical protein